MRRTRVLFAVAAVLLSLARPIAARQDAQSAASLESAAKEAEAAGRIQEAFDLYVRAVQALPDPPPINDDIRLRGQIVSLALNLQPRPAPSEVAEEFAIRAQVLFRDANDEGGFKKAESELRKAVRTGPWIVDFAYNLALVQEKLAHYKSAAGNLKVYLLSKPSDADTVRTKMYELGVKAEDRLAGMAEDCDNGEAWGCFRLVAEFSETSTFLKLTELEQQKVRRGRSFALSACNLENRSAACGVAAWARWTPPHRSGSEAQAMLEKGCRGRDRASCFYLYSWIHENADAIAKFRGNEAFENVVRRARMDRDRAIQSLKELCNSSAWACNALGQLYENPPKDMKTDASAARSWLTQAAALAQAGCDNGVASDCSAMGWVYASRKDNAGAAMSYQRACDLKVDDGGSACDNASKLRQ